MLFILLMVGAMPMALVEPFLGLLLWVLLSDMNPYREVYGFASTFHWVYIVAILTLVGMVLRRESVVRIYWSGLAITLLLFTISASVSTIFALVPGFAHVQYTLFIKVMVVVACMIKLVNNATRAHWMVWVLMVSIGFWAAKGGVFTLAHGGNYRVIGPEGSFIGDNNTVALAMCMALPLMRYLQFNAENHWLRRGLLGLMGLTVMAILGTYSRGGLITLAAVLLFLILKSRKRVGLLITGGIIVFFAMNFLPTHWKHRMEGLQSGAAVKSASFEDRIQSWEFATNVGLRRPLTGGGFGVWASRETWNEYGPSGYSKALAIHSIWFKVLAEQGVSGLILYILMLVLSWHALYRIRKKTKPHPESLWLYDLAGFLQVSLVGFMVAGSALPLAYFNYTLQMFGLIVALDRLSEENRGRIVLNKSFRSIASIRHKDQYNL
ncbi:putative O-glycosylation ligase, exosortase A system-associated [Acidihalobacter aeolianus]|uniref:Putative O-glycosylation ligase, exosortase A system-associated n=2 Tax=Acidihalobacter aeolianus TaxID=2792603 RepID=A0A1D8K7B0_9GAMM|nr:putative O-glycosylation ligase, exosortase A system-associated [Acidihalobacter aeolianus]